MRRARDIDVIFWGVVLTGAVASFLGAVAGALTGPPAGSAAASRAAAGAPPNEASALPDPEPAAVAISSDVMSMAVGMAPFDPARRAPASRYLLPEDRVVDAPPPPPPPAPPPPEFRVLGTIGGREGGVAVIAVEGEPPRVVVIGEDVLGYTVASIEDRRVVVSKDGRNASVMMEDANASVVATTSSRRGREGGGTAPRGESGNREATFTPLRERPAVAALERAREALDRAQRRQRESSVNQDRTNSQRGGRTTQSTPPRPPGGG